MARDRSTFILAAATIFFSVVAAYRHRSSFPVQDIIAYAGKSTISSATLDTRGQGVALLLRPLDCPNALDVIDSLNGLWSSGRQNIAAFIIGPNDLDVAAIAAAHEIRFNVYRIEPTIAAAVLAVENARTPYVLKLENATSDLFARAKNGLARIIRTAP